MMVALLLAGKMTSLSSVIGFSMQPYWELLCILGEYDETVDYHPTKHHVFLPAAD